MMKLGVLKIGAVVLMVGVITACLSTPRPSTPRPTSTPPVAESHNQRGLDLAYAGNLAEAVPSFKLAVKHDPDNPEYHNSLCWFGSLAGQAAEVLDVCRQAVELDPTAGYIRDSRGLAYALTGDYERAIKDFKYFLTWSKEYSDFEHLRPKREFWISELEKGRNPFDEATLKGLALE